MFHEPSRNGNGSRKQDPAVAHLLRHAKSNLDSRPAAAIVALLGQRSLKYTQMRLGLVERLGAIWLEERK